MTGSSDVWFKKCTVIEFPVAENVKPIDIHRHSLVVYGNKTLDVSLVHRLVLRIKDYEIGKAIIVEQDRSERSVTVKKVKKKP